MKKNKPYKRLPGRRRSLGGQSTLWIGDDHLLAVDQGYFEERYWRFHFNDIQALVVRPTIRWHVTTLILLVLTLVLLAPGWMLWRENDAAAALMALTPALLCLIALVVNLARGKSCRCYLQMKVGVHELSAIRRLRQARKVLSRFRPLVDAAQKDLQVSTRIADTPPMRVRNQVEDSFRPYNGRWHLVLFSVLVVDLFGTLWHLFMRGGLSYVLNFILGLTVLCLTIIALVAQRQTRLSSAARASTWTTLGIYIAYTFIGQMYMTFFLLMKDPVLMANQVTQFQALSSINALEHPFLIVLTIAFIAIGAGCALFGIMGALQLRRPVQPEGMG